MNWIERRRVGSLWESYILKFCNLDWVTSVVEERAPSMSGAVVNSGGRQVVKYCGDYIVSGIVHRLLKAFSSQALSKLLLSYSPGSLYTISFRVHFWVADADDAVLRVHPGGHLLAGMYACVIPVYGQSFVTVEGQKLLE